MRLGAWQVGIYEEAVAEVADSQADARAEVRDRGPRIPGDAGRWIGEMGEIAATRAEVGIPSAFHDGAAAIYRLLERTPFAAETRETLDRSRTIGQAIPVYARYLEPDGV